MPPSTCWSRVHPSFSALIAFGTYIFGSLAVRGLGRSVVDEEAAFCAAIFHDLGLVSPYRRDKTG